MLSGSEIYDRSVGKQSINPATDRFHDPSFVSVKVLPKKEPRQPEAKTRNRRDDLKDLHAQAQGTYSNGGEGSVVTLASSMCAQGYFSVESSCQEVRLDHYRPAVAQRSRSTLLGHRRQAALGKSNPLKSRVPVSSVRLIGGGWRKCVVAKRPKIPDARHYHGPLAAKFAVPELADIYS
jgi:hypothetical protein